MNSDCCSRLAILNFCVNYTIAFRASMEAPLDTDFAIAVKNTGKTFEFPLTASVQDLFEMEEEDASPPPKFGASDMIT